MYAVLSDLQTRFTTDALIQLTDEAGLGTIDQDKIDGALVDATNEINAYVAAKYDVASLVLPEPNLTRYCCDLAYYYLHKDEVPEPVRKRYEDAIKWLTRLSRGEIKLTTAGIEAAAAPSTVEFVSPDRVFSRETMRGL
ncbi:hypothetical protein ABI_08620 [Asticcacaulis biprosthecium C19]|uniref:DUF1320 domain-containing protein n=1 Tax=Asticcacaulis biprosthecium C19 TaxID=715226 RepID=F4QG98_9CAUL|nr:DUF1320 domain-containing protein [Asticcacaulis biprosthecium]EGF92426.1 hypothetical protein ABI_08620 [Asticcacaulis biprosthecium C19]